MGEPGLNGTALIVGAGFSTPAGLPTTGEVSSRFLALEETFPTPERVQKAMSEIFCRFWEDVFGYDADNGVVPSFEDHFTALDLSANAGHNLGWYTPAALRALRRMSIHRVFDILDQSYTGSDHLSRLLCALAGDEDTSLVSTNWDVVVENHLAEAGIDYTYCVPGRWSGELTGEAGFPLIKLHGSANWHYCDVCRSLDFGHRGKHALVARTFLEGRDFAVLGHPDVAEEVEALGYGGHPCHTCSHRPLGARVATFSYSKAFDFYLFHASWAAALDRLREAPFWTFVGYSLPDADFAFRHLLKTAEVGSLRRGPKQVRVVVGPDPGALTEQRYRRFFGSRLVEFHTCGVERWVDDMAF